MDPLVLDLRPLTDDGEDEEAEDEHRDTELQRQAQPFAARRPGADPRARIAYPV